jgi:hypothetical protein
VQLEVFRKLNKFNDLIVTRNRDLPACSRVPQPTTLPRARNTTQHDAMIQHPYLAHSGILFTTGNAHVQRPVDQRSDRL